MTHQYVIVGGSAYTDIDVLACASAYRQLYQLMGKQSIAVIAPLWNQTIPLVMKSWPITIEMPSMIKNRNCSFILVDVSDPHFLADYVSKDKIIEVFDHHFGFENFWREKIHGDAHIEKVGACATLIWEQFKHHNFCDKISDLNANLLYTALFSNTLDFNSYMTHDRDRTAFQEIAKYITLPSHWKEQYYSELQKNILNNVSNSILSDMKTVSLDGRSVRFGQIELWNASVLSKNHNILDDFFKHPHIIGFDGIVNVVSIAERKSYIFTNSEDLLDRFKTITNGVVSSKYLLSTSRLWQRKELLT